MRTKHHSKRTHSATKIPPAPCHPDLSLPAISASQWQRDQSPPHSIHLTSKDWIWGGWQSCHGPWGQRPTASRRSRECRRPFLATELRKGFLNG